MLKRLIGVITIKNNWAVQSIGYKKYLPLGRPEVIAENYDRWQLDEILIIDIDRSKLNKGPNFDILEKVSAKKIMTPLSYVGGIRDVNDAINLISSGADRVGIDNLFRSNEESANLISQTLGRQAVIRVQPMIEIDSKIYLYDHLSKKHINEIDVNELINSSNNYSELMITDLENEGKLASFSSKLIAPFNNKDIQIICFGGISEKKQIKNLFNKNEVSAVAIGNSLSYQEIPHKSLLEQKEIHLVRKTSFGAVTKGAREW